MVKSDRLIPVLRRYSEQALHEPSGRSEATTSSPRPSPPVEEREKNAAAHGHNACARSETRLSMNRTELAAKGRKERTE